MMRASASRCNEGPLVTRLGRGRVAQRQDDSKAARRAAEVEASGQVMTALNRTVEAAAPWLLDLGTWIFGALIGFDLLMVAALLTVGPVDRAVLISTAAFAVGLPPEVSAFVLLRLVRDLKENKIEQIAAQTFADAGVDNVGDFLPVQEQQAEGALARRTMRVLALAYGLLGVSIASALVGITATLWHMAWWIAVAFAGVVVLSQALVFQAIVQSPKRASAPGQPR